MFESIGVLLVFFFLFAFGIQFYGGLKSQELLQAQSEFTKADSLKVAVQLIGSPYLVCSESNSREGACIDKYKVKAWENTKDVRSIQMRELVGFGAIHLRQIYPDDTDLYTFSAESLLLYKWLPPGDEYESTVTQIPMAIKDPLTGHKAFGILTVTLYESTE